MADKERQNDDEQAQQRDNDVNPFPGITGAGAEKTAARPSGGQTGGLFSDLGDGTIGEATEPDGDRAVSETIDQLPDNYGMTSGTSISPISDLQPEPESAGTNSDIAGEIPHGQGSQAADS